MFGKQWLANAEGGRNFGNKGGRYSLLAHVLCFSDQTSSNKLKLKLRGGTMAEDNLLDSSGDVFVVEKIVDTKLVDDKIRIYKVSWEGYGSEEDTWEPEENLISCQNLLKDFWDKKKLAARLAKQDRKKKRSKKLAEKRNDIFTDAGGGSTPSSLYSSNDEEDVKTAETDGDDKLSKEEWSELGAKGLSSPQEVIQQKKHKKKKKHHDDLKNEKDKKLQTKKLESPSHEVPKDKTVQIIKSTEIEKQFSKSSYHEDNVPSTVKLPVGGSSADSHGTTKEFIKNYDETFKFSSATPKVSEANSVAVIEKDRVQDASVNEERNSTGKKPSFAKELVASFYEEIKKEKQGVAISVFSDSSSSESSISDSEEDQKAKSLIAKWRNKGLTPTKSSSSPIVRKKLTKNEGKVKVSYEETFKDRSHMKKVGGGEGKKQKIEEKSKDFGNEVQKNYAKQGLTDSISKRSTAVTVAESAIGDEKLKGLDKDRINKHETWFTENGKAISGSFGDADSVITKPLKSQKTTLLSKSIISSEHVSKPGKTVPNAEKPVEIARKEVSMNVISYASNKKPNEENPAENSSSLDVKSKARFGNISNAGNKIPHLVKPAIETEYSKSKSNFEHFADAGNKVQHFDKAVKNTKNQVSKSRISSEDVEHADKKMGNKERPVETTELRSSSEHMSKIANKVELLVTRKKLVSDSNVSTGDGCPSSHKIPNVVKSIARTSSLISKPKTSFGNVAFAGNKICDAEESMGITHSPVLQSKIVSGLSDIGKKVTNVVESAENTRDRSNAGNKIPSAVKSTENTSRLVSNANSVESITEIIQQGMKETERSFKFSPEKKSIDSQKVSTDMETKKGILEKAHHIPSAKDNKDEKRPENPFAKVYENRTIGSSPKKDNENKAKSGPSSEKKQNNYSINIGPKSDIVMQLAKIGCAVGMDKIAKNIAQIKASNASKDSSDEDVSNNEKASKITKDNEQDEKSSQKRNAHGLKKRLQEYLKGKEGDGTSDGGTGQAAKKITGKSENKSNHIKEEKECSIATVKQEVPDTLSHDSAIGSIQEDSMNMFDIANDSIKSTIAKEYPAVSKGIADKVAGNVSNKATTNQSAKKADSYKSQLEKTTSEKDNSNMPGNCQAKVSTTADNVLKEKGKKFDRTGISKVKSKVIADKNVRLEFTKVATLKNDQNKNDAKRSSESNNGSEISVKKSKYDSSKARYANKRPISKEAFVSPKNDVLGDILGRNNEMLRSIDDRKEEKQRNIESKTSDKDIAEKQNVKESTSDIEFELDLEDFYDEDGLFLSDDDSGYIDSVSIANVKPVEMSQEDYLKAFCCGEYETVLSGIANGMDPNCWDSSNGGTPLWSAIEDGRYDIAKELLKLGSNSNYRAENGKTALMIAVERGKFGFVNMLLRAGAHVNLQQHNGETALILACRKGHEDIINLLLNYGADIKVTPASIPKPVAEYSPEYQISLIKGIIDRHTERLRSMAETVLKQCLNVNDEIVQPPVLPCRCISPEEKRIHDIYFKCEHFAGQKGTTILLLCMCAQFSSSGEIKLLLDNKDNGIEAVILNKEHQIPVYETNHSMYFLFPNVGQLNSLTLRTHKTGYKLLISIYVVKSDKHWIDAELETFYRNYQMSVGMH